MPRPLYRLGELTLVFGAVSGDPPRDDLRPLGEEPLQEFIVLVVDDQRGVGTKPTELLSIIGSCTWSAHPLLLP